MNRQARNIKCRSALAALCFALVASASYADSHHHFGYDGAEAPEFWGDLAQEWSVCKTGKFQSPIDINTKSVFEAVDSSKISFNYTGNAQEVINNGHTLQVNFKNGSWIDLAGKRFNLLQVHFHTPSEYTFDGKHFPMVAHLVHKADDGQMLVIAEMFQEGVRNTAVGKIFMEAPKEKDKSKAVDKVDISSLVSGFNEYYRLSGSLTTPPCTEGVIWIIDKNPTTASKEQMDKFTNIIGKNNRPVQDVNGRTAVLIK